LIFHTGDNISGGVNGDTDTAAPNYETIIFPLADVTAIDSFHVSTVPNLSPKVKQS